MGEIVRDSVKNVGELAPDPRVPCGESSLEFLGDKTTVIDLYGGPGDALSGDGVGQGGESQLVGKKGVSPLSEKPETLCDPVAVAEGEGDHVVLRRMEDIDEFGQRLEGG